MKIRDNVRRRFAGFVQIESLEFRVLLNSSLAESNLPPDGAETACNPMKDYSDAVSINFASDSETLAGTLLAEATLLGAVATSAGPVYVYDVDGPGEGIAIDGDYDETDGTKYNPYDPANDLMIVGTPGG
ncbi:MAG TPA: hypothetical protein PL033_11215, partial [Candidatus Brocadiia bacterium]|nr:hypothetical protein [Candidatus Brocadiia bacterium]